MSKLYTKYLELKKIDKNKMYLFKSGIFYYFIDEDAKEMNRITLLKCIPLTNDIVKCGFPESVKDKYLNILKACGKDIELITMEKGINKDKIRNLKSIDKLLKTNINEITGIEALKLLEEIKKKLH